MTTSPMRSSARPDAGRSAVLAALAFVPRVVIPIFLVVLTVYFGRAMGLAIYLNYFQLPGEVKVPAVVGKDVQEAQQLLHRLGLDLEISETKYQEQVSKNQVMTQDPAPQRSVRQGRKVAVVVSLGPEQVMVPRVMGLGMRDARMAVENAKLKVGKVTVTERRKGDPEMVVDQNPRPGKQVRKGEKVNITVNMGNVAMVKVPRFEGLSIDKVRDSAGAANLRLGSVQWVLHEQYQAGTVIRQDPPPDKAVTPGTEVDLKVSAGNDYRQHEIRQRTVVVHAPDQAGPQDIRVNVVDPTGSYIVYQGTHYAGETVTVLVTGVNGGEYEVYANDKLISRKRI